MNRESRSEPGLSDSKQVILEPHQVCLLQAAFTSGQPAAQAWEDWRSRVDIDHLPPGTYDLLPRLYLNLQKERVTDPLMPRLKGVYRRTWAQNQQLWHQVSSLLPAFEAAELATMLLGRTAQVVGERVSGCFPLDRIDLLVKPEQASVAIELLNKAGWLPIAPLPARLIQPYLGTARSHAFRQGAGVVLRLHWCLFWPNEPSGDLWAAAVDGKMDHTSQFLYACAPQRDSMRLWETAVALHMLTQEVPVAWDRLLEKARKYHLLLALSHTLAGIQAVDGTLVPPAVSALLQAHSPTSQEKLAYRLQTQPPTAWRRMHHLWLTHQRALGPATPLNQVMQFPRFLKSRWRLVHSSQLLMHVFKHLGRSCLPLEPPRRPSIDPNDGSGK